MNGRLPREDELTDAPKIRTSIVRLVAPTDKNVALGWILRLTAEVPAFSRLPYGPWAGCMVSQVDRGHVSFALDDGGRVVGLVGWSLVSQADADAWLRGERDIPTSACVGGDAVVVNVWHALTPAANAAILDGVRRLASGRRSVSFKRLGRDGRVRPCRLAVTPFVATHVTRTETSAKATLAHAA